MKLLSGGTHAARKLKRAQVLLAADSEASDEEIARSIGVGKSTVYRTKRRFVLGNREAALSEEPRRGAERKFSGKEEALLVATACSSPPAGRARWTLELLAGEMVKLTTHESVSRETVRRRLAENDLKPWRKDMWCIRRARSTKRCLATKPGGCYAAWSSITCPSTPPGSIWSRSTSASSLANVWIDVSTAAPVSAPRPRPGRNAAMPTAPA
jgi:transposase